ncbi:MAG: type I restriction endonuclease [Rikenellaceae bacterium]
MDFKDSIKQISERVEKLRDNLQTEEATKNALILPFLSALGYDVFNPLEILPEMSCDIGTKKGEKIDYAVMMENEPIILIECKHWKQNLSLHDNQLLRYFNVSKAKFGILTNGVIYKFYTDLVEPNKMDSKPFLEINMLDLKEHNIEELKKFHKSYFDVNSILSSASELKYVGELRTLIANEFANPSSEFVKYFGKQIYDGLFNARVAEQFAALVKRSISAHITDMISDRLKAAIGDENSSFESDIEEKGANEENVTEVSKIITTEEELEGYYIVKAILRNSIPSERITYRDAQSYFSIFIDDNNRKPVCRLYLNSPTNKKIVLFDENKKETILKITSIDEIYKYADSLLKVATTYL